MQEDRQGSSLSSDDGSAAAAQNKHFWIFTSGQKILALLPWRGIDFRLDMIVNTFLNVQPEVPSFMDYPEATGPHWLLEHKLPMHTPKTGQGGFNQGYEYCTVMYTINCFVKKSHVQ